MTRQAVSSSSNSSNSEGKENVEEEKTALQKHVAFFDRNKDGVVYPWETYQGFRALGTGRIMSAINAVFINMGLSQKTRPGKIPSPLFPIEVKNIHLGIHGSDTDIYDKHGRFVESKFEKMFRKHSNTHTDALTRKEVRQMLKSNREPFDIGGWFSAFIEWKTLRDLGEDGDGLLKKDTVRGVYDGSFFYRLAKQLKKQRRLR